MLIGPEGGLEPDEESRAVAAGFRQVTLGPRGRHVVIDQRFGTPAVTWSMLSGPGTVAFENPNSAITTARFSAAGAYTLRCTATVTVDGQPMQGSADRIVQPGGLATSHFTATFREGVNAYVQAATFIRGDTATWNSGARDQFLIGRNNSGGMRGF